MSIFKRVLGGLALVTATAAPLAAHADEPCDPPSARYVEPIRYWPYAYAPEPIVVRPEYRPRWRWEARRIAEARREAYRRWLWRERHERFRTYDYDRY